MENKIKEYVNHIFKVNKINDNDMYEEILSNLLDRYEDLVKQGIDENKAYVETIKHIGDFEFTELEIDEKFSIKPNWASISLLLSLALSVIAVLSLFISIALTLVIVTISIGLHIASSHYLFHLSQNALKVDKDVSAHNNYLKDIFKNLKTVFVFWNISISYIIASIITEVFILIVAASSFSEDFTIDNIFAIVFIRIIFFIIIFIILYVVLRNIYTKLERKYYQLTGQDELKSSYKEYKLFDKEIKIKKDVKEYFTTENIITLVITLFLIGYALFIAFRTVKVYKVYPNGIQGTIIGSVSVFNAASILTVSSFETVVLLTILVSYIFILLNLFTKNIKIKVITPILLIITDVLSLVFLKTSYDPILMHVQISTTIYVISSIFVALILVYLVQMIIEKSKYKLNE